MKLNVIKRGETIEVKLEGTNKIYILNQETLQDELNWSLSIEHKKMVLNLSEIHFIDTTGFRLLLDLNQLYKNLGKKLELSHVTKDVEELLNLVKINQLFGREMAKETIDYITA